MPFQSSPLQYAATSSPQEESSPCKRRKILKPSERKPLLDVDTNSNNAVAKPAVFAGFIDDDDSDDERLVREQGAATASKDARLRDHDLEETRNHGSYGENGSSSTVLEDAEQKDMSSIASMTESLDPGLPIESVHDRFQMPEARRSMCHAKTCSGNSIMITERRKVNGTFYGDMVAARSKVSAGRAQRDYYGIDIHNLIDAGNAALEIAASTKPHQEEPIVPTIEQAQTRLPTTSHSRKPPRTHLWTEKYRARKFTDLLGDERTHRSVLRWLKGWDPIVFPHAARPKAKVLPPSEQVEERPHRKVLLLTGPAGLGKTTLAHVCAKQAGYEVQEINASDDRSAGVVKGRIRDMVGTENVRTIDAGKARKAARPVCVVVDEVDGVVGGNSHNGGEGGFIKALVELLILDQRNTNKSTSNSTTSTTSTRKKKGEHFRVLRPLILICNDVYHPSLRLLRHSPHAEVIHVRRPPIGMVVPRLASIFEKEGIPCDNDGVRTLCEAAWGVTSRKKGGAGSAGGGGTAEGDVRGILVVGEWVAGKLRAAQTSGDGQCERLTRRWIEKNVLGELAHGGGGARSLGRGGGREAVERVFAHNAGFPMGSSTTAPANKASKDPLAADAVTDPVKRMAMERLREVVEASGEEDRIMTGTSRLPARGNLLSNPIPLSCPLLGENLCRERPTNDNPTDCFTTYPHQPYADTTTLTKPTLAHDWLHFHSLLTHRIHTAQDWELAPYLSYPILGFHSLFASTSNSASNMSSLYSTTTTTTDPSTIDSSPTSATTPTNPFTTNPTRMESTAYARTQTHTATLQHLHSTLTLPLSRLFRSHAALATELIPYTLRILNPAVKPVLVSGQASVRRGEERERVDRGVGALAATGVNLERGRVDAFSSASGNDDGEGARSNSGASGANMPAAGRGSRESGGWVYRLVPAVDDVGSYPTMETAKMQSESTRTQSEPMRKQAEPGNPTEAQNQSHTHTQNGGDAGKATYALRHVLAQALERETMRREGEARVRRGGGDAVASGAIPGRDAGVAGSSTRLASASGVVSGGGAADGASVAGVGGGKAKGVKRDFFGRPLAVATTTDAENENTIAGQTNANSRRKSNAEEGKVWLTYHEGYSKAVRKPITLTELLSGL